ncbi:MAG: hypothetical protein AB4080_02030 [Trichodesmium sp.]
MGSIEPLKGTIKLAGEMGRWGDGEMGRWGDGEMGKWGDDEARGYFYTFFPIIFVEILTADS